MARNSDYDYSEHLKKRDWEVHSVPLWIARPIIKKYHYSHGVSKTAVSVHGLCKRGDWFGFTPYHGITWWLPPVSAAAAKAWWSVPEETLTLSRLVIIPGAPKNAATFLLMQSVKQLDPKWKCLLTYADTWQGHTGGIYKAAGWEYLGMTIPTPVYILKNRMISQRVGARTRTHKEMIQLGAELIGKFPKHRYRFIRK